MFRLGKGEAIKSLKELEGKIEDIFKGQSDEKLEKDANVIEIYEKLKNTDITRYEITSSDPPSLLMQKIIADSIVCIKRIKYVSGIQEELTTSMQEAHRKTGESIKSHLKEYIVKNILNLTIRYGDSLECYLEGRGIFELDDYRNNIEEALDFRKIKQDGEKFREKEDEIKTKTGYALFMIIREQLRKRIGGIGIEIPTKIDSNKLKELEKTIENTGKMYTLEAFKAIRAFEYNQHIILQPDKPSLLKHVEAILKNPDNRIRWMGLEGISGNTNLELLLREGYLATLISKIDGAIETDIRRIEQYRIGSDIYRKIGTELTNLVRLIGEYKKADRSYDNIVSSLEAQQKVYGDISRKYKAVETFLQDIFQRKENIRLTLNVLNYLVKENSAKPLEAIQKGVSEKEPAQLQATISYLVDKGFVREETPQGGKEKVYSLNKEDKGLYSIASRIIPPDIKEKFGLNFDFALK